MDEVAVDRIYQGILQVLNGEEYESIMTALGAVHNAFALNHTLDEDRLRALYNMMAEAAVCLSRLENDCNKFQATKDPSQKAQRAKTRKTTGNESGPSGFN